MAEIFIKSASVLLAVGFCTTILLLVRQSFPGWASDAAMSRGAGLSLLSLLVALFLSSLVMVLSKHDGAAPNLWVEAYIAAGLCEESARLLSLILLLRGMMTKDPREFIAGVTAVGLGFGVIENLSYLSGNKGDEMGHLQLGAIRGIISAPLHLACAYATGYGLWSVAHQRKPLQYAAFAFAFAIFLHGTFDMALMSLPSDAVSGPAAMASWQKVGIGCIIVATIIIATLCTLLVFNYFLQQSRNTASHEPSADRGPSQWWQPVAACLALIAIALALMAPAALFMNDAVKAVQYTPLFIGGAISMALWSFSIRSLFD